MPTAAPHGDDLAPPTLAAIEQARRVVGAALPPTPLLAADGLGPGALLKLEAAQPTGSFKVRGALAALSALPPDREVVTVSTGNHAMATAWAAGRLGRRARIVVPSTIAPPKLAGLRRFGGTVDVVEGSYDVAEAHALRVARASGRWLSPYNDPLVIAGQSTLGAELEHLTGPLTVVVQVGGGGLLAGVALWARRRGDVRVVGVESAVSLAVSTAIAAGKVTTVEVGETLADGMAGNIEADSITVGMIAACVDAMVTVDDAEIATAMRWLATHHGVVAEGAGAVGVAALLAGKVAIEGRAVAIVSGRNVALPVLARVLSGEA